jgi:hypothetical protein
MKKWLLLAAVAATALLAVSCVSFTMSNPQAEKISFNGADAATGATFIVASGVTVSVFNGETVNWSGAPRSLGGKSQTVYVPAGLNSFSVNSGFTKESYDINFEAGASYMISTNVTNTGFLFEKMNR